MLDFDQIFWCFFLFSTIRTPFSCWTWFSGCEYVVAIRPMPIYIHTHTQWQNSSETVFCTQSDRVTVKGYIHRMTLQTPHLCNSHCSSRCNEPFVPSKSQHERWMMQPMKKYPRERFVYNAVDVVAFNYIPFTWRLESSNASNDWKFHESRFANICHSEWQH